jgi:hypothetical protein
MNPDKRVIDIKCLPVKPGNIIWTSVTLWLLLDRIGIADWGWGVYWTWTAIMGVVGIIAIVQQKPSATVWKDAR